MGAESDERAVRELINGYSDAANRRDPAGAAATYAEDGVLVARGVEILGRAAILESFRRVFSARDLIFQVNQPGPLELAGDRAYTRTWIREWTRLSGKITPRIFLGLYQDEMVRTAAGWRFARRRLDGRYTVDPDYGGTGHDDPPIEHVFAAIGRDPAAGPQSPR